MMKKVAILQSNYIPWKGYFDIIAAVDEFILYDDMQYTKRDWRNRNMIKTSQGVQWLTVPVLVKGKVHQRIRDAEIEGTKWMSDHWKTLERNYKKAPFFDEISRWLRPLYLEREYTYLSDLNRMFIEQICIYLGIKTLISNSWDYGVIEGRTERLVDLSLKAKATEYLSGPSARDYIDVSLFDRESIRLTYVDYGSYPVYPQLFGDFTHYVTILDLLFNCGPTSSSYMHYSKG